MPDQLIEKLGIDKCLVVAADIVEHFSCRITLNYNVTTSGINTLLHFDLGYTVRLVTPNAMFARHFSHGS